MAPHRLARFDSVRNRLCIREKTREQKATLAPAEPGGPRLVFPGIRRDPLHPSRFSPSISPPHPAFYHLLCFQRRRRNLQPLSGIHSFRSRRFRRYLPLGRVVAVFQRPPYWPGAAPCCGLACFLLPSLFVDFAYIRNQANDARLSSHTGNPTTRPASG